ncbi:hypothetical protein ANCCAN_00263 [Ancylostoma caninum]|uniref:MADF domain-containing protein n=1 Tax=Ancylostoma caninum TaxID=29170 RepID=A0A368HDR3_ANCCA|nr:hypothetical protein ANCCAN_00263 [Ancylostoma caninum]
MLKRVKVEHVARRGDVFTENEKFASVGVIRSFVPIWNSEDTRYKDLHVKRSYWSGVAEEMSLQFSKQDNVLTYKKHIVTCGILMSEKEGIYKNFTQENQVLNRKRYGNVESVNVEDVEDDIALEDVGYQDEVVIEPDDVRYTGLAGRTCQPKGCEWKGELQICRNTTEPACRSRKREKKEAR